MQKLAKNTHQETVKPSPPPPKYNLINNTIVCNIVGKTHNIITKNVKTREIHNLKNPGTN